MKMKSPLTYVVALLLVSNSVLADPPQPKYGPAGNPLATPLSFSHDFFRNPAHPAPDFWALSPYYLDQHGGSACSAAAIAMLVNAARRNFVFTSNDRLVTQAELLRRVNLENWRRRAGTSGQGVSLDQLGRLTEASLAEYAVPSATVEVVHVNNAGPEFLERLHRDLVANEASGDNFILINFLQGAFTNDAQVGHIAPIAAFDEENSKVLIMDPDREWYEPYWISEQTLLSGLATLDAGARAFRGYVKVQIRQTR